MDQTASSCQNFFGIAENAVKTQIWIAISPCSWPSSKNGLLVHFSFQEIRSSLETFKNSGSKYLMTTTFTSEKVNRDIDTGGWRRLDLCGDPINLPPPEMVINEKCPNPKHPDKSLGLWKLADITPF